jgi:hypothetical protein
MVSLECTSRSIKPNGEIAHSSNMGIIRAKQEEEILSLKAIKYKKREFDKIKKRKKIIFLLFIMFYL